MSKLHEKPSALKREYPARQKIKVIKFFQCLCVIFSHPDTDPGTPLNPDTDPDPQHCTVSIPLVVSSLICCNEKYVSKVIVTFLLKAKKWSKIRIR